MNTHFAKQACEKIKSQKFGLTEGVRILESECFMGTNIKSLTLPKSLECIGESAFFQCEFLTTVTFAQNS